MHIGPNHRADPPDLLQATLTVPSDVRAEPWFDRRCVAGETVILLHPLLSLVGVSIRMERGCQ